MKIFCIGNPYPYVWKITPGKTYDLLDLRLRNGNIAQYIIDDAGNAYEVEKQDDSDGNWLIVKCDDGIRRLFTKDVFQSISEWREKRLKEIGI